VEYRVERVEEPYPVNAGYLYAQWRKEQPLIPGEDFRVLETRGRGHYIGCVVTFSNATAFPAGESSPAPSRGHLEGDARYYVDGSRSPIVAGTGTEEYFNWGWYDIPKHDAPFSFPTHGYPLHVVSTEDQTVMYRFHLTDLPRIARTRSRTKAGCGANRASSRLASNRAIEESDSVAAVISHLV
jgi:hypothetical protein